MKTGRWRDQKAVEIFDQQDFVVYLVRLATTQLNEAKAQKRPSLTNGNEINFNR